METPFYQKLNPDSELRRDPTLRRVITNLATTLERDRLVRETTEHLQQRLEADRVVLYYFYRRWKGQVTFEALSDPKYSIFGSTGPDECFNGDYADLYLSGRTRAVADIETEPIADCHRDFLRGLEVQANLVVPVLTAAGLWGLLIAHQCQGVRSWSEDDIAAMRTGAEALAIAPSISG